MAAILSHLRGLPEWLAPEVAFRLKSMSVSPEEFN
jgi:hypothetical protein